MRRSGRPRTPIGTHGSINTRRDRLPSAGVLRPTSSFADLADLWLADLELRTMAASTKEGYRTRLRLHVRPAFEHYPLAESTTGRAPSARSWTESPTTMRWPNPLHTAQIGAPH